MERINITFPDGLPERAHNNGLNISKVCANAVEQAVQKLEYIAVRVEPSKNSPETATANTPQEAA